MIHRRKGSNLLRPERRCGGPPRGPALLYSVRWETLEGLPFSRACISIARVRFGCIPQSQEFVMAKPVVDDVDALRAAVAQVDEQLNAAVAAVEDAKAALRRAQVAERALRAARGRAAASVDPKQLAFGS